MRKKQRNRRRKPLTVVHDVPLPAEAQRLHDERLAAHAERVAREQQEARERHRDIMRRWGRKVMRPGWRLDEQKATA